MRETQFIDQNKEKWDEFEQTLDGEARNADQLRNLFVRITDDLSFSRTFYPNRSVRVYLNGLAQRIFLKLYRSRRPPLQQVFTFWSDELPREVYRARKAFRLSFVVFVLSFVIGMLSCAMDAEFAQVILGDSYVEMTRANIESGDPMAVYKERGQFNMFLSITFNNLYVAFLAFGLGVFFGVGSLIILLSNGILVGCFQYFFIQHGLFWESFLTIWIHGTLEISAIVIAAAAGITMGRGAAFPGTLTRVQSIQQSARRGAKIMLGIAPIFILAGCFEAYLTRHTETPDLIRGLFIFICLAFILIYFVWYPRFHNYLTKQHPQAETQRLPSSRPFTLEVGRITATGDIFSQVFGLLRKRAGLFSLGVFGIAAIYTIIIFGISDLPAKELFPFRTDSWAYNLYNFTVLFALREGQWVVPLVGGAAIFAMAAVSYRAVFQELNLTVTRMAYLRLVFGTVAIIFCVAHSSVWTVFTMLLLLPLAMLYAYVNFAEKVNPFSAISRLFRLIGREYLRLLGIGLLFLVLGWTLFSIVNSQVGAMLFQVINWLVIAEQPVLDEWSVRLTTFLLMVIANFIWALLLIGFALLYYTLREINEATELSDRIERIGQTERIRGLERE